MILLVTMREFCERTKRNKLVVSHGINVYTDEPVVLSEGTPEELGAVFDSELREYVIITPQTRLEDKIRAHAGFTEDVKTAMALFLPKMVKLEIVSSDDIAAPIDPSFLKNSVVIDSNESEVYGNLLVKQSFADKESLIFSGYTWSEITKKIRDYHHESVLLVGKALFGKTASIHACMHIAEQLEDLVVRNTESTREISFSRSKKESGSKPAWCAVVSKTHAATSSNRSPEKINSNFEYTDLAHLVERISDEDKKQKSEVSSSDLLGMMRNACGFVENGTSTTLNLTYEADEKLWRMKSFNGETLSESDQLVNLLNRDSDFPFSPIMDPAAANCVFKILEWLEDRPGHELRIFQDDATKSWHAKINSPNKDQQSSSALSKSLFESDYTNSFAKALVGLQEQMHSDAPSPSA